MDAARPNMRSLNLARRLIYVLMAAVVVTPFVLRYFIAIPLPIIPSNEARRVYDKVNSIKPGGHVLLAFDFEPSSEAELRPMARALMLHCFRNGLVPVVMTHWPGGLNMDKDICERAAAEAQKLYGRQFISGRDWVLLGFRPGGSNLVLHMGVNLKGDFPTDVYGQSTASMPALAGVTSLKDMNVVVDLAAGSTVEMWIVYGSDRLGFPLAAGTTAVMAPDLIPFVNSGQLVGYLGGLRGAADYETLVNAPGLATSGMLAQSAVHVMMALLIIGANVVMFMALRSRKGRD
ncbi:MAG: hypothetical protein ACE15C_16135 [Phycisphaerae bacterium]